MSSAAARKRKNASGSRTDVAWEHGVDLDGTAKKIQCKYCSKIVTGGAYRFKHHLACTRSNVSACISVPDDVKKKMIMLLSAGMESKGKKQRQLFDSATATGSSENESVVQPFFSKGGVGSSSQLTMNAMMKKDVRKSACKLLGDLFYTSGIPFNVARNPLFAKALEEVAQHGPGFMAPSYHEIKETLLNEKVAEMNDVIERHREEWKRLGCTIMSDAWSHKKRRSICNFLVNSPKGTVFLKSIDTSAFSKIAQKVFEMLDAIVNLVGEENVVQVVTNNDAAYKAAGTLLMAKRKNLYWTPCAANCIDLMLEDFEKKLKVHQVTIRKGRKITSYIYSRTMLICILKEFTKGRDLVRPAMTRFSTAYLTLSCLMEHKGELMAMFSSPKWKRSKFVRTDEGKNVQKIVLDSRFWLNVDLCLRAALPLVKVLRMVDSDEQPAMPFLYEEMDCAKEKIQSNYNNVKTRYEPIWSIIDERWNNQLHRPLHAAAHYLNPRVHYRASFNPNDREVKNGLFDSIEKLVKDRVERLSIIEQLDTFHHQLGMFGRDGSNDMVEKKHPADWWNTYGDDVPELQKFAIRVLSLTCSSSGCEHNWSAFEMIHAKERNRLHQKKMNDLVYVMYNSKLKNKKFRNVEKQFEEVNSDEEWITERGANLDEEDDDDVEVGGDARGGSREGDDIDMTHHDDDDDDDYWLDLEGKFNAEDLS